MSFLIIGGKGFGKSTVSGLLSGLLPEYERIDFGEFIEGQLKNPDAEYHEYFKYHLAKKDEDGNPNFFDDLYYRYECCDIFRGLGGFASKTINIGMPRSTDQLENMLEQCDDRDNLRYIVVNCHPDLQADRIKQRYAEQGRRINESKLEDTLKLDQMFRPYVVDMVNHICDNYMDRVIPLETTEISGDRHINVPIATLRDQLKKIL